jgi:hypothetical protein
MKLKRNSWYGQLLDHPKSWCGLIFTAVCELAVAVFFIVGWTVGNWEMVKSFDGDLTANMFMAQWGMGADIFTALFLLLIVCVHAEWIQDQIFKLMSYCPRVEWEDE